MELTKTQTQAHIILFGSRAREKQRAWSDIDLAIEEPHPIPERDFDRLKNVLSELVRPYRLDLLDLSLADNDIRTCITHDGIVMSLHLDTYYPLFCTIAQRLEIP